MFTMPNAAEYDDDDDEMSYESDDQDERLLKFDEIYKAKALGSDILKQAVEMLTRDVGVISGQIIVQGWLNRLTKSAYNRTLRFAGQRLIGATSRTLLALGVRIGTARVLSEAVSGMTTRVLLAMSKAASGIGTILTAVELLGIALDMAIMFGWDPGNYNAEMGNNAFDGIAVSWARMRTRERVARLDPYWALRLYGNAISGGSAASAAATDDSAESTPRVDRRFALRSFDDAPWFFQPFPRAVRAIVEDTTSTDVDGTTSVESGGGGGGGDEALRRIRQIFSDQPVVCDILWTVHYFSHRRFNSNGQRMRGIGERGDVVEIGDKLIRDNVRANELAAFLSTTTNGGGGGAAVPRARLLGAARRNFIAKSVRLLDHAVALVSLVLGATFVAAATATTSAAAAAVAWCVLLCVLFVALPMTLIPTAVEMVAAADGGAAATQRRTYDRRNESQGADRDDLDRLCDELIAQLSDAVQSDLALGRLAATPFRSELRILAGAN